MWISTAAAGNTSAAAAFERQKKGEGVTKVVAAVEKETAASFAIFRGGERGKFCYFQNCFFCCRLLSLFFGYISLALPIGGIYQVFLLRGGGGETGKEVGVRCSVRKALSSGWLSPRL